jgi:hypothetical protein
MKQAFAPSEVATPQERKWTASFKSTMPNAVLKDIIKKDHTNSKRTRIV